LLCQGNRVPFKKHQKKKQQFFIHAWEKWEGEN
jgi:hypothetical protein